MRKYLLKLMFLAFVGAAIGYNTYNSQIEVGLSDLTLSNIEALANGEVVSVDDCDPDTRYNCEALHPTDPSKDEIRVNAVWK